ncbi:hypothetical protein F5Y03DRAFT_399720 [Xylaria venustula]|nr:hypothetical protein F5Y03DRAFT_399720 [Xylaria venustula]
MARHDRSKTFASAVGERHTCDLDLPIGFRLTDDIPIIEPEGVTQWREFISRRPPMWLAESWISIPYLPSNVSLESHGAVPYQRTHQARASLSPSWVMLWALRRALSSPLAHKIACIVELSMRNGDMQRWPSNQVDDHPDSHAGIITAGLNESLASDLEFKGFDQPLAGGVPSEHDIQPRSMPDILRSYTACTSVSKTYQYSILIIAVTKPRYYERTRASGVPNPRPSRAIAGP